ncbi:MAG: VCBS repeat-containing protein [Bacteroidales bacterium]|nr:VCBS repeat-containing protein [Bacteroidales bacterium]
MRPFVRTPALRLRLFIFLPVFLFASLFSTIAQDQVLWTYLSVTGNVDATPAVADVDGDGVEDLVMATTGGTVLVLDARGHIKWQYEVHHTISTPVAVAGRPLQIYALTNPGGVVCLDARRGIRMWEYTMPEGFTWGSTAPVAADLDGDGTPEILVADRGGHLVALRKDGSLFWKYDHREGFRTAPALADLDGDGQPEILLGTDRHPLVCFSHKGRELWHSGDKGSGSSPLVMDITGDGHPEILCGNKEGLTVSDAGGHPLWHHTMQETIHDGIAAGDINGDGTTEVVVADMRGNIACLSSCGQQLWTAKVGTRVRRSPTLADIDGDGCTEVLVSSYSGNLTIFDNQGNLKMAVPLHGGMNSSPIVVDFLHDGRPAVVCATTSDVTAFNLLHNKTSKGKILLGQYRLNAARTGALPTKEKTPKTSIITVNYGDLHTGTNHFTVTVRNPLKKKLSLQLTLLKEGGGTVSEQTLSTDTLFSYSLPYSIPGDLPLTLHFSYRLTERGKQVAGQKRSFYLLPFVRDLADLQERLASIRRNLTQLDDQDYVRMQLLYLEREYAKLSERSRLAGTMTPLERASLRTQYEQIYRLAGHVQALTAAAAAAGSRLTAYAANPWAPFGGVNEIAEGRTPPPQLTVEAFGGETESAAFNLANYSNRPVTVRIEPSSLVRNDSSATLSFRKVLSFHEVVDVPTHSLDLSADALPHMNGARTLTLAPWTLRQVWINIDASQIPQGEWHTKIRCRTLEVEPAEAVVTLQVKVWPVSLTREDPLRLCHWGYVESSVLKEMPEEALDDQVRHGTNVFVAGSHWVPAAAFDTQGNLTGKIDFSVHDRYVRDHVPYGLILFFGYQGALKGPAKMFSPVWTKAYKEWIRRWRDHLQTMGVDYEDYAFYPIDEPGLHEGLVDKVVKLARAIKEVDPRLQVYADPVSRASMDDLKKMAPYLDIWCPNRNGYLLNEGNDKLEYIKSTGKTVWTYECEGDAKHQSPLGYYRSQSWLVWWRGLTGIGFWSYCTSRHNPWYVPRGGQDYLLIYQGNGVVTSKRWEAVRDGMEDYGILYQLQQSIKKAKATIPEETIREAQNILNTDTYAIARYCGLDKEGTVPGTGGMKEMRKVEDMRWKKIMAVRREIASVLKKMEQ